MIFLQLDLLNYKYNQINQKNAVKRVAKSREKR